MSKIFKTNKQQGSTPVILALILTIILTGLLVQRTNTIGNKLVQSQKYKATQSSDNFIRLAINRTRSLINAQALAVSNDGGTYPQMTLIDSADGVSATQGSNSVPYTPDYLTYIFSNPRYIAPEAGGDNVKNPQYINVKVEFLDLTDDEVDEDGMRQTYMRIRASMTSPVVLSLTVKLKPLIKLYTQVTTGFDHTCALAGGEAFCWGSNRWGQLGTGTFGGTNKYAVPQKVIGSLYFQWLSAGKYFTCGLASTSPDLDVGFNLYCWGRDDVGQLARTVAIDLALEYKHATPTIADMTGLSGVLFQKSQLRVGEEHGCAIRYNSSEVYCWGLGVYTGTNAAADTTKIMLPTKVNSADTDFTPSSGSANRFCELSASSTHTCVNQRNSNASCDSNVGGKMFCWGKNTFGQLGNNTVTSNRRAVEVAFPSGRVAWVPQNGYNWAQGNVFAFKDGTCAQSFNTSTSRFELFCWGQFDTAYTTTSAPRIPTEMCPSSATYKFCRYVHAMARDRDDRFWAITGDFTDTDGEMDGWPADSSNLIIRTYTTRLNNSEITVSLPNGMVPSYWNPMAISPGFRQTSSGHYCTIANDRRLYCWGENGDGQLGLGDLNNDGLFNGTDYVDKILTGTPAPLSWKVTILPRALD